MEIQDHKGSSLKTVLAWRQYVSSHQGGKWLSMMDCKTEGTAHQHLRSSISYKGESIWGWRSTSSALGWTGRELAQRLSWGLHSYYQVLVPLVNCWIHFCSPEAFWIQLSRSGGQQYLLHLLFPLKYQVIDLFVLSQHQWFWSITYLCLHANNKGYLSSSSFIGEA